MKIFLYLSLLVSWSLSAQIIIQSGLTHRFEFPPGGSKWIPLSVKNIGNTTLNCLFEISDVASKCDSGYQYLAAGTLKESCAAWLRLEREHITLLPGAEAMVKVLVESPEEFTRASARACVLVNSTPVKDTSVGIKVRVRYAINFLYRNPIVPGVLAFHAQRLEIHKNQPFWALRVQNTGNVDRIVRSYAKLINDTGEVVYSEPSIKAHGFIPNQCRTLQFPTPKISAGNYQMVVVSETDQGERFGVTKAVQWGGD